MQTIKVTGNVDKT